MKTFRKGTIWYKVIQYGLEILGRYYSSYRGFVVENEDPKGCNRLQLRIPVISNKGDESWAWPQGTWGGDNYGIQMLPKKGDMVWVEFENGDPGYPIWKHASYAKEEKPKEFETPNHYGFKTPRGTKIIINDNKEDEEVLVMLNNELEWIKITKELLEHEAKIIKIGKNGDEPLVLGDTLKEKLDELVSKVDNLISSYNTHTHATPFGPTLIANNVPDQVTNKKELQELKVSLDEILSLKGKIDKE